MLNKLTAFLKDAQRTVVIGMGNELRADDGIGLLVIRLLKPYTSPTLQVFEGHMTPEVYIAPACRTHPTHLLIVDAAELHRQPGEWRLLSPDEINQGLFTTHTIPALEIAKEIQKRCGAKVGFLGIQPKSREIALTHSHECLLAAEEIADNIRKIINKSS